MLPLYWWLTTSHGDDCGNDAVAATTKARAPVKDASVAVEPEAPVKPRRSRGGGRQPPWW